MKNKDVSELIKAIWHILSAPNGGEDFSEFLDTLIIDKISVLAIVTILRTSYAYKAKIANYSSFVAKCYEYILTKKSKEYTDDLFTGLI